MKLHTFFTALALTGINSVCAATPIQIDTSHRTALALTIYNQDLALVHESRDLPRLNPGDDVILAGVSEKLQADTLRITNAGPILEQNFSLRQLSRQTLLDYYLNQKITLARTNPANGEETQTTVRLLSVNNNHALIERSGQIETIPLNSNLWRFIFPQRPPGLMSEPSLSFRSGGTDSPQRATFSYLTRGLSWQMNYVLNLDTEGSGAQLSGMASLTNDSGTPYRHSLVQLMAGDILQPRPSPRIMKAASAELMSAVSHADSPTITPAQVEAFHLYRLPQPLHLDSGQQKQVTLISSETLPVRREYLHSFYVAAHQDTRTHKVNPRLKLSFDNTQESGLGQPMPAGSMRVFRPDSMDRLQFVGGGQIPHTAEGTPIELTLGQAFDITIERKQTLFENTYNGQLVGQELRISNANSEAATVMIEANFSHPWELERSSLPMERDGSGTARWAVTVPGKGSFPLNFSVHLKKSK